MILFNVVFALRVSVYMAESRAPGAGGGSRGGLNGRVGGPRGASRTQTVGVALASWAGRVGLHCFPLFFKITFGVPTVAQQFMTLSRCL